MAWTSPRTWVSGELVTAAIMNTHVRDNLLHIAGTNGLVTKRQVIGPFTYADLPANASTVDMNIVTVNAADTVQFHQLGYTVIRGPGRISGMSICLNGPRSGGTATFQVTINAGLGTLSVVIDDTLTQFNRTIQLSGDTFDTGNRLGVKFTTTSDWTPTTREAVVFLELTTEETS